MPVCRNPARRRERPSGECTVREDRFEPGRLLSLAEAPTSHAGRDGTPRPDAEGGVGIASLWLSENHLRITTTWLCGQPQARFADDARGQPALCSAPRLCGHDRLASYSADLSEPGTRDQTHGHQPAMGADITYIRLRTGF